MIQYPSQGYDGDYVCGLVSPATTTAVSVAASSTYAGQITTTNNTGAVTYTQSAGSPSLLVSSSGAVTTSGQLGPGNVHRKRHDERRGRRRGHLLLHPGRGRLDPELSGDATSKRAVSAAYRQQLAVTGSHRSTVV